jgi:hypothetical protein
MLREVVDYQQANVIPKIISEWQEEQIEHHQLHRACGYDGLYHILRRVLEALAHLLSCQPMFDHIAL